MDQNKDFNKMRAIENQLVRGFILKLLEITHPQPSPSNAIATALIENGLIVNPDISRYTSYLQEKGYIETIDIKLKSLRFDGVMLKLTPQGVDLLEGTLEDPGVDI